MQIQAKIAFEMKRVARELRLSFVLASSATVIGPPMTSGDTRDTVSWANRVMFSEDIREIISYRLLLQVWRLTC